MKKNTPASRVEQGHAQQAEFEIAITQPEYAEPTRRRTISAAPVSIVSFAHHMRKRYPVRIHRMRSDARWLRKHARKFGVNPDEAVRRMPW